MKVLSFLMILGLSVGAQAEESNCTIKGMSCPHCASTIKEKICTGDKFSMCEVNYDEKAKLGKIHIATKETNAKVDAKELSAAIADTNYKVAKCEPVKDTAKVQ